jgi:hypothetical protein
VRVARNCTAFELVASLIPTEFTLVENALDVVVVYRVVHVEPEFSDFSMRTVTT